MAKRQKFEVELENGRHVWLTGETISDAFRNGLKKYGGGLAVQPGNSPRFQVYAEEWYELYKKPKHRPTTLQTYRCLMDKHILPYFGAMTFDQITTNEVQRFLNQKGKMAESSVKQMKILLHEICKAAMEDGYMLKDPTASSRLTLPTRKKIREALSTEQFVGIVSSLSKLNRQDAQLVSLLCHTGMRRGEVLGLRWEDISDGMICVQRSITFKSNQPIVGPPKSHAGNRWIPIADALKPYLTDGGTGYIIGGGEQPITESKFDRTWQRISKTIDLYGATPHVLRHTYLTLLGATDANVKTIQAIAGHADIQTTMNRYVHSRHEDIRAAGEAFSRLTGELTVSSAPKPLWDNASREQKTLEN